MILNCSRPLTLIAVSVFLVIFAGCSQNSSSNNIEKDANIVNGNKMPQTEVKPNSMEYYVATDGSDSNPGSFDKPFASIEHAQNVIRKQIPLSEMSLTVYIRGGSYYLTKPIVFTAEDSGSKNAPVIYSAYKNESVVISGGLALNLNWTKFRDGIYKASTPSGIEFDQLFVNNKRQHQARYPNYDENTLPYNGYGADAFSPQRAAKWQDPKGGYIHAMHSKHWGGYHYLITGKADNNKITYEGGWQNNRQMGMHREYRFVENIFEELDTRGEWFHDTKKNTLYYYPPIDVDLNSAKIEVEQLRHTVEFQGAQDAPVRYITMKGLIFRHTTRTFMETKEPLLRSDWAIYRGGAVMVNGAEDCEIRDCEFDSVGGNAIFVNNYNRRITIRGSYIHNAGGNGICFVGSPESVRNPLFEYNRTQSYGDIDKTPGPKTDNYPSGCLVDNCLITKIGRVEKQATGVQISMAMDITVRHCSIYDVGRAGINISEGTFGGHIIEFCDVFDTVKETGDHGSFNSWGRDRFWRLKNAPTAELPTLALLDAKKTIIRNSRWRCDHGWDIDLDDGSSNYEIYNNLMLRGGLKLREGFHRKAYNNICVNSGFHPHVWYDNCLDEVTGNIWMRKYEPRGGMPRGKWGKYLDKNLFTTESAYRGSKSVSHDCDQNSIVGDPQFVDPENGDFRLKEDSVAFKLGFKNFPMDKFGVQKPSLKAIAKTPIIPKLSNSDLEAQKKEIPFYWQGALVKELTGQAYSAFGIGKDEKGLHLVNVPSNSLASRAGLKNNDLLMSINGVKIESIRDLLKVQESTSCVVSYVRNQVSSNLKMKQFVAISVLNRDKFAMPQAGDRFVNIVTSPKTNNQHPNTLFDGKLANNYGPVFSNGTKNGLYKLSANGAIPLNSVSSYSYNQGGNRAAQYFTLYLSNKNDMPKNLKSMTPLCTVDTRAFNREAYQKTVIAIQGGSYDQFRHFVWAVSPVNDIQENTSFQEFQLNVDE